MSDVAAASARDVISVEYVEPSKYSLELSPDLDKHVFKGHVAIDVTIKKPGCASISLNANELYVSKAKFVPASASTATDAAAKGELQCVSMTFDLPRNVLTLTFEGDELPVGEGVLDIEFTGELNNQMCGFYRSSYTTVEGEKKTMASTQFEAIDARRCFPCWDEPNRKAVFSVTLVVDSYLTALSNMPVKEETTLAGNKKRVLYDDTPIMSTYLLAFVVGEFDYVQADSGHGVTIRAFTPPGKSEHGQFALDCAVRCLDLYDDFFGLPYPLTKLDMVAIPEFAAGAMENWGLVTYREVDLLIHPEKASSWQRERVCTVVTHELAHQWFGNLVTMDWWDDLWLNEGFACFMQTWSADHLFPEWSVWDSFPTGTQAAALRLDGLKSSHPIQVPIGAAKEVDEVFDAISYCKGACVIRMIYCVLGEEAFRKGLQDYMAKHKYGNTVTLNLWDAWSSASGVAVGDLMSTWTEQCGYPVVTVTNTSWADDSVTIELSQEWFLSDGSPTAEGDKIWTVPLIFGGPALGGGGAVDGDGDGNVVLMRERTMSLKLPLADGASANKEAWLKLNFGQGSMMVVAYNDDLLERLSAGVSGRSVPKADRAALLLDALALAKAGRMAPETLIKLLSASKNEDSAAAWEAIASVMSYLGKMMAADVVAYEKFTAFAANMIEAAIVPVGWDPRPDDQHRTRGLRATLISLLAKFSKGESTIAAARQRFEAFVTDPDDASACPADTRVAVFKIVLRAGGASEYEAVRSLYTRLGSNAEKKHVLNAIGAAATNALKTKALDWTTSGAVLLQDFFYPIYSVGESGPEGVRLVWTYFKENFARLRSMLASANSSLFAAVIRGSCGGFVTTADADEVEAFFKTNPCEQNQRLIAQLLESIRGNAGFADRLLASPVVKPDFWQSLS